MSKQQQQENSILVLLRLCTFLLAAVSFWSTAQGMREYTFPSAKQAYAASLGIQGLLLGLNFSLPAFWKKCKTKKQKAALSILTAVILFCSSWFSYLYIAGQAYGKSWDMECQLLAQDIYRRELFSADEYAERYAEMIEEDLSNQVVALYRQASSMETSHVDVAQNLNLEADLDRYAPEGSSAREIMQTMITALEPALAIDAPQDVKQLAADTINAMQTTMQSEISSLNSQIEDANERASSAADSLSRAETRLKNAPDNVDIQPYQDAVNIASQEHKDAITERGALMRQRQEYQSVLQRSGYYASLLGMSQDGASTYFVGTNLKEIQKELFSSSPDSGRMLELAEEIFERLQSGIDFGSGAEDAEYQDFISQMNQFVRSLNNYQALKQSNTDFQELITQLSEGQVLALTSGQTVKAPDESIPLDTKTPPDAGQLGDVALPLEGENSSTESENLSDGVSDNEDNTNVDNVPGGNEIERGNDSEHDTEDSQPWENEWLTHFNILKAKISGLPTNILQIPDTNEGSTTALSFDRAASTKRLDQGIRNYLTLHNPAQQGIIYLASPYREIAIFSIFLAFLLDIAAFITGFIIDRVEMSEKGNTLQKRKSAPMSFSSNSKIQAGLNRYIFLTGDYQFVNGIITYKAIEQGEISEIECTGNILQSGIYLWNGKTVFDISNTNLLFKGSTGGPQDGIYEKGVLHYESPVLTLSQNGTCSFLGHVDSKTPVFSISKDQYEVFPADKIEDLYGNRIIIALDKEGKTMIGIYIIN